MGVRFCFLARRLSFPSHGTRGGHVGKWIVWVFVRQGVVRLHVCIFMLYSVRRYGVRMPPRVRTCELFVRKPTAPTRPLPACPQVFSKVFEYIGYTVHNSTREKYTPHEYMMRQLYTMSVIKDNMCSVNVGCWERPGTNMERVRLQCRRRGTCWGVQKRSAPALCRSSAPLFSAFPSTFSSR